MQRRLRKSRLLALRVDLGNIRVASAQVLEPVHQGGFLRLGVRSERNSGPGSCEQDPGGGDGQKRLDSISHGCVSSRGDLLH